MRRKPTFHKNLFHELSNHKAAYVILIIYLTTIVGVFTWAGYDIMWQRLSIMSLGLGYFIWGVITHISASTITTRLIFEYAAISILASVSLIALTI